MYMYVYTFTFLVPTYNIFSIQHNLQGFIFVNRNVRTMMELIHSHQQHTTKQLILSDIISYLVKRTTSYVNYAFSLKTL